MATGFSEDRVKRLLGRDGVLRKLGLCSEDFELPLELLSYLNGYSDSTGLWAVT